MRAFQTTTTAVSFRINGNLSGSAGLTVTAPTAATLTLGTTPLTAGTASDNTGYTGTISLTGTATAVTLNQKLGTTAGLTFAAATSSTFNLRAANFVSPLGGSGGLNATYYNFGSNPGVASNNFAIDTLYLHPRTFSRTDLNVNMPQAANLGDTPIIPVLGYAYNAAGGQNDGTQWKGLITIGVAGTYQFSGTSDDNLTLIINGTSVGSIGVSAPNISIGAGVFLSSGQHSIVVRHTNGVGGGYATLSYNGGVGSDAPTTMLVPSTVLSTGSLAPTSFGALTVTTSTTLDITVPMSATSLSIANATLTLNSATMDSLTIGGGTITAATPTIVSKAVGLTFTGAISDGGSAFGLNFSGPYLAEFRGVNTYTGLTTVTGGQLRLNTTGGDALSGSLTINAANAGGAIANVRLMQSNQIFDTSGVTITQGILDVGAFNDTIANLTLTSGSIIGSGTLTVTNAPTLTAGTFSAGLGGNFNLLKAGTGTVILSGPITYTGVTSVNDGILVIQNSQGLGMGGATNETVVTVPGILHLAGANISTEDITINGPTSFLHVGGISTINNLTTGSVSTVNVASGQLQIGGLLTVTLGALTKTGAGSLTFTTTQLLFPAMTHTEGSIGFSGVQSFGAAAVPAGLSYLFNSDPGAGVTITAAAGSSVIGNYNFDQNLVDRLAAASDGNLLLGTDNTNNLDFSVRNVSLGAHANAAYAGAITPNAAGYRLVGGAGRLDVFSTRTVAQSFALVTGTNALTGSGALTKTGLGTLMLAAASNYSGAITVASNGGTIDLRSNATLLGITSLTLNQASNFDLDNTNGIGSRQFPSAGNQSTLNIAGATSIPAYDYFVPATNTINITINGLLTGSGAIVIDGPQILQAAGGGIIQLGNPILTGTGSNDYSGTITINPNAILANQVALIAGSGLVRTTGSALATSTINLNGGRLRFRDDATSGGTAVAGVAVAYGNNVTLSSDSYLDDGRVNTTDTTSIANIINLGTLTVTAGTKVLFVDSATGTGAGAGNGNYQISFATLDGAGSLVKAGQGRLNIGAVAGSFMGDIAIAGPAGFTVAPAFGTVTAPNLSFVTPVTLNSFTVNGMYVTEASKAITVNNALTVGANAGNVAGALVVSGSTTLAVGSVVNNGTLGAGTATATITSTAGYSGNGFYATSGQQLNLAGGGITSAVRVAGNNIVNATAASHNLASVQVQSGTLKLTPTAAAATSGTINVFGAPATIASGTTTPVAATNAILNLDSGTAAITHTGNITNSGTVLASAGVTTVSGIISGTTLGYVPGLVEGYISGPTTTDVTNARPANPANFGVKLEPRMFQTNVVTQQPLTGHTDNELWVYTGYIKDNDGVFSFAQNVDDRASIWIDGQLVLNANNGGTIRVISTAFQHGQAGSGVLTANSNLGVPDPDFIPSGVESLAPRRFCFAFHTDTPPPPSSGGENHEMHLDPAVGCWVPRCHTHLRRDSGHLAPWTLCLGGFARHSQSLVPPTAIAGVSQISC